MELASLLDTIVSKWGPAFFGWVGFFVMLFKYLALTQEVMKIATETVQTLERLRSALTGGKPNEGP